MRSGRPPRTSGPCQRRSSSRRRYALPQRPSVWQESPAGSPPVPRWTPRAGATCARGARRWTPPARAGATRRSSTTCSVPRGCLLTQAHLPGPPPHPGACPQVDAGHARRQPQGREGAAWAGQVAGRGAGPRVPPGAAGLLEGAQWPGRQVSRSWPVQRSGPALPHGCPRHPSWSRLIPLIALALDLPRDYFDQARCLPRTLQHTTRPLLEPARMCRPRAGVRSSSRSP